ncbi:endolytic transglycosylase MltG [Herbidospora yilanensis]|uniref:endolytic transglycosylase MltG n=1 Tax=Herbidospora yilanensis TaxID=354426 RepID=UPI001E52BA38|nr:endolytic transglycosylase MltG [Herbidospora yilanensis]
MDSLLGASDEGGSRRSRKQQSRSRRRRRRTRRKGAAASLIAIVIIVGILGGGGYLGYKWVSDAVTADDYTGSGSGEVVIVIEEGASAGDVAAELEKEDVVASARAFIQAVDAAGKGGSLQPGHYAMKKRMSAVAAVGLLDPDKRLRDSLTIPEGYRATRVYDTLADATGIPAKEFADAAKGDIGLPSYAKGKAEGFLFPATYELPPNITASEILTKMTDRFNETAQKLDLNAEAKRLGFTPMEIMTVASIVQAESGTPDDMGKVARVIYNRLALNPPMKLQMDSTTMYGLGKYGIAATFEETRDDSPYNTYRVDGLPPGPIANPGDHAIEAALKPAKGDWLFFVTTDPENGITEFTASEAEFVRLRDKFHATQN